VTKDIRHRRVGWDDSKLKRRKLPPKVKAQLAKPKPTMIDGERVLERFRTHYHPQMTERESMAWTLAANIIREEMAKEEE
jgi:hypothetical protein